MKQKAGENTSVPSSGAKVGSHLESIQKNRENCHISEILEQESIEMDTPLNRPGNQDTSDKLLQRLQLAEPGSN